MASGPSTVIRSLACWTSEAKRASLRRVCTSSVSAALSSVSASWVASERSASSTGSRRRDRARDQQQPANLAANAEVQRDRARVARRQVELVACACAQRLRSARAGCRGKVEQLLRDPGRERRVAALGPVTRDREPMLVAPTQQRDAGALEQRADRVERGARDLVATRRRNQRRASGAQHALALHRPLLLAHEAGHARDHEREEEDRGADDHDQVAVACAHRVQQLDRRRDQRRAGQQREPRRRELGFGVARRLLQLPHRRMQGGSSPQHVEGDPADVEAELVVVCAVQEHQPVHEVGHQQREDARAQQVERAAAPARVHRQAHRCGEQQHVAQRVGDRHQLWQQRHRGVVQVGRDQRGPGRQREPERHDRRVDPPARLALRVAPSHEQQQARHQHRVDGHVEAVPERRERNFVVQQLRVAVGVDVAEPEEAEADDEAPPRNGGDGTV